MLGAAATLTAVRDGHTFFYRFDDAMYPSPVVPFERRVLDRQEMTYLHELERRLQAFARERLDYQHVLALLRQRTKLSFPPHTERAAPIYEGLRQVLETGQALTIETNDLTFGFDLTVIANQVLGMAVPVTYKLLTPFSHPPQGPSPPRGRQPAALLIANPSANPALRGTEEEVAALHGRYTQAGVRTSVLTGKHVNLLRIAQAFATTEATLLYIAGEFNEEGIPLADGETLRPEHILRYVECRDTTVILNGCSSLQTCALSFLRCGASPLIGTSRDIADYSACRFGGTLLEVVAAGISPSHWFHAVKVQYHVSYPDDASALFYHLCAAPGVGDSAEDLFAMTSHAVRPESVNRQPSSRGWMRSAHGTARSERLAQKAIALAAAQGLHSAMPQEHPTPAPQLYLPAHGGTTSGASARALYVCPAPPGVENTPTRRLALLGDVPEITSHIVMKAPTRAVEGRSKPPMAIAEGVLCTFPTELPEPIPSHITVSEGNRGLWADREAKHTWAVQRLQPGQPRGRGVRQRGRRLLAFALLLWLERLEGGLLARLRAWALAEAAYGTSRMALTEQPREPLNGSGRTETAGTSPGRLICAVEEQPLGVEPTGA